MDAQKPQTIKITSCEKPIKHRISILYRIALVPRNKN